MRDTIRKWNKMRKSRALLLLTSTVVANASQISTLPVMAGQSELQSQDNNEISVLPDTDEIPVEEFPIEEFPMKEIPVKEIPVEEDVPVEEISAEEYEYEDTPLSYIPEYEDLPDNDELFTGFMEQVLYPWTGISLMGNTGERHLTDLERAIYLKLKEKITEVANGNSSSAKFTLSWEELGIQTTWTKQELGVDEILTKNGAGETVFTEEAVTALTGKIAYDWKAIVNYLLVDCPYELYWYDKTAAASRYNGGYSGTTDTMTLTGAPTFSFTVADDYAGSGEYTTDSSRIQAAKTTAEKAIAIVEEYSGKSDREKLEAYKNVISSLVSYNVEAAEGNYQSGYGDPWQLIYVFDGNADTKVVCEGYAKAFQYLCDLSTFTGNVKCYTVTGEISGSTVNGAGNTSTHMWNIVTIDGESYLVDITNHDKCGLGEKYNLFLVGTEEHSEDNTYTFSVGTGSLTYTYDDGLAEGTVSQLELFGEEILTLSGQDYSDYTASAADGTIDTEDGISSIGLLRRILLAIKAFCARIFLHYVSKY